MVVADKPRRGCRTIRLPIDQFDYPYQGFSYRRIRLKADGISFTIAPAFAMPYMTTMTQDVGDIIGSVWTFVILEEIKEDKYGYFISKKYDAVEFDDLQKIYKNLQSVKQEIL